MKLDRDKDIWHEVKDKKPKTAQSTKVPPWILAVVGILTAALVLCVLYIATGGFGQGLEARKQSAMEKKRRWGIGQVVFSGREQLALVRPLEGVLTERKSVRNGLSPGP